MTDLTDAYDEIERLDAALVAALASQKVCLAMATSRGDSIEKLKNQIVSLEITNAMHQRHMGNGEFVTRVALDSIWKMLGVDNQTEASMKLQELLAK